MSVPRKTYSVVFIAYHYPPSNEIGARRNGALVRCLVEHNIHVIVVSRFGTAPVTSPSPAHSLITHVRIPDSSRWAIRSLVAAKQWIRGLRSHPCTFASRQHVEEASNAQAVAGSLHRPTPLRDRFVQLIESLDGYKLWSWRAARAAHAASKAFDARAVIASGPPMTNLLAGFWAARFRKIPFIADFRDPWYAGFEHLPGTSALERTLRSSLESLLVQRSTAVTVTTDSLAEQLISSYAAASGKIHVVRNGFDGEPRQSPTSTGHYLRLLYAGEIYMSRDPFPFLAALERLLALADTDSSRISATFVGQCESYRGIRLADWLRGKKCEALVHVLPPVTPGIVATMVAESSVLLNFAQASPLTVPAKTYEHMASGREILVMCEAHSGTARLVGGIPGVTCVDPLDCASLDRALADLYRRHVLEGALTPPPPSAVHEFSRELQNRGFIQLVQSLPPPRER